MDRISATLLYIHVAFHENNPNIINVEKEKNIYIPNPLRQYIPNPIFWLKVSRGFNNKRHDVYLCSLDERK